MKTHKMCGSPEYSTWQGMKARCLNPNNPRWHKYGGGSISLCKEWENSFEAFFRDMGKRPEGMSLDRVDNSKGYFKENCRWATNKQQSWNSSRVKMLELDGENLPIAEWARRLGVRPNVISMRLNKYKWSVRDALTKRKSF